jgi:hypothetical protein
MLCIGFADSNGFNLTHIPSTFVGTVPKPETSRLRFSIKSFDSQLLNPSSRTVALGSTHPLIEMSTRNLPWVIGSLAWNANNLTVVCKPIV